MKTTVSVQPPTPAVTATVLLPVLLITAAAAVAALIWFGPTGLDAPARLTLLVFFLAVAGWTVTSINDTSIALGAVLTLAFAEVVEPQQLFATLGHELVWLLVAAFIIAAALRECGLTARLALAVTRRARSVRQLFYWTAAAITLTAFIVPSTSGRAALLLPLFLALSERFERPRIIRALALLFPTVILLTACASLLGAGAHLITAELLLHYNGEQLDFGRWLLLGTPFAVVSAVLSTEIILRLFLSAEERRLTLACADSRRRPLGATERYALAVVTALVIAWASGALHGIDITLLAVTGALLITLPPFAAITLKQGVKAVEWNLLLFMVAVIVLGDSLIQTGAAGWLVRGVFDGIGGWLRGHPSGMIGLVAAVALLAHLAITSRSARASVLIPLVILLAVDFGYNPALLAFVCVVGTGFCQTLAVSAKPVALFSQLDQPTYRPTDLLRLSLWLLPPHFVLLLLFAQWVWPLLGLPLR